jgi:hypothetical protein
MNDALKPGAKVQRLSLRRYPGAGWEDVTYMWWDSACARNWDWKNYNYRVVYETPSLLERLPPGYMERAIENYHKVNPTPTFASDLTEALSCAFPWRDTPEGFSFWREVTDWTEGKCDLPSLKRANLKHCFLKVMENRTPDWEEVWNEIEDTNA